MLTDEDIKKLKTALKPQFDSILKRFDDLDKQDESFEERFNGLEESIDSLAIITEKDFDKRN